MHNFSLTGQGVSTQVIFWILLTCPCPSFKIFLLSVTQYSRQVWTEYQPLLPLPPQNSYVEALTTDVMVFGGRVYQR